MLNFQTFLQTLRELDILLPPGKTLVEYSTPGKKKNQKIVALK